MKHLVMTMPNNTRWRVPARCVAEHRARHYAPHDYDPAIFDGEVAIFLAGDDCRIVDWASNNMCWADMAAAAESWGWRDPRGGYSQCWADVVMEVVEMRYT